MERISRLSRWIGHASNAQFVWSIVGAALIGILTRIAHQPTWKVLWVSLGAFAILIIVIPRMLALWRSVFGAKLIAEGLHKATNTPVNGMTAVRLILRNRRSRLTGFVAHLVSTEPPLMGFPDEIHLPLALATKTRWDAFRAGLEPRPNQPFNLNAGQPKHIELFWLGTIGALQGTIAHQAGDSTFLVYPGYVFHVEISGEAELFKFAVRLFLTDDETGAWDCELVK